MARINIEEKWWTDPRRAKLGQLLGNPYFTESVAVLTWRLAQEYWEKGLLIPGHIFVMLFGGMEILRSNLAVLHETELKESAIIRTPLEHISTDANTLRTHTNTIEHAYVYVRGASELLSWGQEIRRKRVLAGQQSARKRAVLYGSSQPLTNKRRTKSNTLELSGSVSVSSSGSSSGSISNNYLADEKKNVFDFETLYEQYPLRDGDHRKAVGLARCRSKIKTKQQYEDFKKAVSNYKQWVIDTGKVGTEGVKQFGTFANEVWKEWVAPKKLPTQGHFSNGKVDPIKYRQESNRKVFEEMLLPDEKESDL